MHLGQVVTLAVAGVGITIGATMLFSSCGIGPNNSAGDSNGNKPSVATRDAPAEDNHE